MPRPTVTIAPDPGVIELRGVRQNNLKGFDLDLPLGKLIVVSGPSGSGKSSLAFDTIYAEGQRRYVETFSPYTRQFFERMDKPKVDSIRGIPPAIAIEQANAVKTTRSTVGTITEINEYLKLLLPRVVQAFCPDCAREVRPESAQSITEHIFAEHAGETLLITFGVPVPAGTVPQEFFGFLQQQGYLRVWLDGEARRVDDPEKVKRLPALVPVIQDRITVSEENRSRLCEAIETALRFGKGKIAVHQPTTLSHQPYSTGWHCAHCDLDIAPPSAGLFSFNNPLGACAKCRGFGRTIAIDLERAIPDRRLSIAKGAIKPFQTENGQECQRDLMRAAAIRDLDVHRPFQELSKRDQEWVMQGEDASTSSMDLWKDAQWYGVRGFFDWLESKTYKMHVRVLLARYRTYTTCPDCNGGRYQRATMNFRWQGRTLPELQAMSIEEFLAMLDAQRSAPSDSTSEMLLGEITSRLRYLALVGLGYLSLDRPTKTLSGGELERVNLTTCLGASLVNTLFVLDEPSVGLHPRDTGRLIHIMQQLRDKGNTLLVVEHEEAVIRAADHLVELGPGRGEAGGDLVFSGPLHELANLPLALGPSAGERPGGKSRKATNAASRRAATLTADYLSGAKSIPVPGKRRAPGAWLTVEKASEHNLRDVTVDFPLGVYACVTGVSGSGKSTLVHEVLYRQLLLAKGTPSEELAGACAGLEGAGEIGEVVMVDQSPLARTPRSSPAVYLGVFDPIRELFAMTPDALAQGMSASAFSFNSGNGRCERCMGSGWEKIEMQFLSDVFVRCPECEGRRYQSHVLTVKLYGKSIHEVLEMTVTEAIAFFSGETESPESGRMSYALSARRAKGESAESHAASAEMVRRRGVAERLRVLEEVGLGYLTLGQPLNVLSGGESQRLKLVERLTQRSQEGALLILDEPTTGLHFDDVAMLVRVFDRLVEKGNSLLVIEHNLEVIKCADWVIDLGPEAGAGGGYVVAVGTPEEVARVEESHTGRYLRQALTGAGKASLPSDTPAVSDVTAAHTDKDEAVSRVAEDDAGATLYKADGKATQLCRNGSNHAIHIRGAREHNLKDISLSIPRDQMVVITGLSGSGKSTLAFDILFAEGQRRFLDSMSAYARQFVEQMEKPEVDSIAGLPPTVAIEQRITRGGGKSTVATVTEVYHFLRLLWAKLGTQFCPKCDVAVEKQTLAAAVKKAEALAKKGRIRVLAPLVKARKGFHTEVAKWAERHGFEELMIDGKWVMVDSFPKLERFREHTIDVLVGERPSPGLGIKAAPGKSGRRAAKKAAPAKEAQSPAGEPAGIAPLLQRALEIGKGTARIIDAKGAAHIVSIEMSCPGCGQSFEELDPRLFSFNSPHGACPECHGFGEVWKVWVNPRLDSQIEIEMDKERQHEGLDATEAKPCPTCHGARLNAVARHVRLQGRSVDEITALSARAAHAWITKLKFGGTHGIIAADILPEIAQRLSFMGKVGLDYLALGRSAKTLSGGESQRIRLAAQLGSNLRGVLYVLDEPTIGLHPRDNAALLDTLTALKNKGNSLVIVEHDDETMRRADHIIDLGPGAGRQGGAVVAEGTLDEIRAIDGSTTGNCFRNPLRHPLRGSRRPLRDVSRWLEVRGASLHNLKNLHARIPVGRLTVLTGISGSGKSTLMRGVLKPAAEAAVRRGAKTKSRKGKADESGLVALHCDGAGGREPALDFVRGTLASHWKRVGVAEVLEAVYEVDQSPIGKTTRSTPATYIKVFDTIRELFAQMPLARMRGYSASRFSFNTEGGRCETCLGQGMIKIEMNFLPTSWLPCPDCHGLRYNPATLEVLYNDRSIGNVMQMTLAEAAEFFKAVTKIHRPLSLLCDTGLGYLQLGQPSPTLSGGEAQRLKLIAELTRGAGRTETARLRRQNTKSMLYLLEEPTIGLHLCDVQRLLDVLHRLVDDGATVVVIEHHLSLIAEADYVIDIGPEAGEAGGEIVACGPPEDVAKNKRSRTAPFLREVLAT